MKIKYICVFVLSIFILAIPLSIGCNCSNNLKDYRIDINKKFNIDIPQEWTNLYYNQGTYGGWHGDGTDYYVFEVTARDEEFFREFTQAQSDDFENSIKNVIEVFDKKSPIEQEYLFDLEEPYEWLSKWINEFEGLRIIYQSNRLYVFARW